MAPRDDTALRNHAGQAMGAKGRNTRRRLMQAAAKLLEATTLSGLRVADIAAEAGTSTAAFYRYFVDTAGIVLAVVDDTTQSTETLLLMAGEDWPGAEARARAQAFVGVYFETWEGNAAILRVRNLAAEAGDARFYAARERAVRPLQDVLAGRLERARAVGRLPADLPLAATAGVLIALLERMAAIARRPPAGPDISYDTLLAATAHILAATLSPPGPLIESAHILN